MGLLLCSNYCTFRPESILCVKRGSHCVIPQKNFRNHFYVERDEYFWFLWLRVPRPRSQPGNRPSSGAEQDWTRLARIFGNIEGQRGKTKTVRLCTHLFDITAFPHWRTPRRLGLHESRTNILTALLLCFEEDDARNFPTHASAGGNPGTSKSWRSDWPDMLCDIVMTVG